MKIAYFGNDYFIDCLEKMIESDHDVVKIFVSTCDNIYNFNLRIKALAEERNIEIQEVKVSTVDLRKLSEQGCELIVVAGYKYLLPILENNMICAINIHPALLPEGRGPWPTPWFILKNLKRAGLTIHKIDKDFDSGDILSQQSFNISEREDQETLTCKFQILAPKLLDDVVRNLDELWNNARPQGMNFSYWDMPELSDRTIDWNSSVNDIDRIVRAFGKFDSCAIFDEKEWIVQDASVWEEVHTFKPGTVAHRSEREVVIAAKDGFVCLKYFKIDPDFEELSD